jgi:hypothetical protein
LALTGVGGIVLAHAVGYALAFPDGGLRASVLRATGHGYWPVAVALAALAAGGAVVLAVGAGVRRTWAQLLPRPLALAAFQVVGFLAVETSERIAAGIPLSALLHERAVLVGVVVQVLVALAAYFALRATANLAERLAPRRRPWPRVSGVWAGVTYVVRAGVVLGASAQPRAPPVLAV